MERKGICKNVGACARANKVQVITDDDADFICPECGEKLEEYKEEEPAKNKKSKLPMVIGCVVVAVAVIVGCIMMLTRKHAELGNQTEVIVADTLTTIEQPAADLSQATEPTVVRDTVVVVEEISVPAPKPNPANGSLRLSYGTYVGDIKNGYPHGQGRLTYSTARQINRNDVKGRTANAGDYVIGEFFNGFVVYGKLYNSKGELLGSLNFGVGPESNYESK